MRRKPDKYELLEERIKQMPEIPEQFYKWCEDELMSTHKYIFYKRKGRYAEFYCGCCGATYKYATEPIDSYEGQFEHIIRVPKDGTRGCCEKCGERAIYKPVGRSKNGIQNKKPCYLIQKYGDKGGAVVRYFEIYKLSKAGEIPVFRDVEINRAFFIPGEKKVQKDYQIYSNYLGNEFWIPNNTPGMATITLSAGMLYTDNLHELEGTELAHTGIEEYAKDYDCFKVRDYMEAYRRLPALEMIVKMKLTRMAENLLNSGSYVWDLLNSDGRTAAEILRIDKKKLKKLISERGSSRCLTLLQMEKRTGIDLSEEIEEKLLLLDLNSNTLETLFKYMSAKQFINRVMKYSGVTELSEDMCSKAFGAIKSVAQMYGDYISMREECGYDMNNLIITHPRNLTEEHHKMIIETNTKEAESRIQKMNNKYKGIEYRYKELCEIYEYEDESFIIRPAKDAGEIVLEGQTLHHCVGGEGFLSNHEKGYATILFLRPAAEKRVPFITVEIRDYKIQQWYGAYNEKPIKKEIDKWLDNYLRVLKKRTELTNIA